MARIYSRNAEQLRYANVRHLAFASVREELADEFPVAVKFGDINLTALRAWARQWQPLFDGSRDPGEWDWETLASSYLRRPDAFQVAIWSAEKLCGLALGRPSNSHRELAVHFIEGSPDPDHPLKGSILMLSVAAADAYAAALGADWLLIDSPAAGLLSKYSELGFASVVQGSRVSYCERRVSHG